MAKYFSYGKKEIDYLKSRDKKLAECIDKIGIIQREVDEDLFSAVVHQIVGQQISSKALTTIWQRMQTNLGIIKAENVNKANLQQLQSCGISFRKAEYIKDFASQVADGKISLTDIKDMSDEQVIKALVSVKGIGVWTAEMILLFCLERPNVFSFDDLAILRGLRMVYHHRKIDKKLFEKYRRKFSPYCSVASLYLWAVAGGAIPELKDHCSPKQKK